jgi:hypothetical protein
MSDEDDLVLPEDLFDRSVLGLGIALLPPEEDVPPTISK